MTTFIDKYELQLVEAAKKTKENHMYENPIKTRIRQTVRFVQQHPTLCACAATAVITARLTRDDDVDALKDMVGQLMRNEVERSALLTDTTSFIDARGLTQEFFEWAPRMRRE